MIPGCGIDVFLNATIIYAVTASDGRDSRPAQSVVSVTTTVRQTEIRAPSFFPSRSVHPAAYFPGSSPPQSNPFPDSNIKRSSSSHRRPRDGSAEGSFPPSSRSSPVLPGFLSEEMEETLSEKGVLAEQDLVAEQLAVVPRFV